MTLRKLLFWTHLVAAVAAGLVILLMSVTGVLLTYERQMIAWSDSHLRSTPAGTAKLAVEAVIARVVSARPDTTPSSIAIGSAPDAPVVLTAGQKTVYVDAYSGQVLGEGAQGVRRFMSSVRGWHRWFAVEGAGRTTARAITGWSNVIFLFIVASGLYLWLPRKWTWQHLRPVVLFKGGLRGKARDFNWHNTIGLWSAIPLLVVVASAVPISFQWGNALVYRLTGDTVPAPPGGGAQRGEGGGERRPTAGGQAGAPGALGRAARPSFAGLTEAFARAESQVENWRTITLRIPPSPRAPLAFNIDRGDGGQPQLRSTLTLARGSNDIVSYEAFADQTPGRRARSVMRFAHTGEVLGIPGQTIAGLATAGAVVLVWTGLALALRRLRAWLSRRASVEDERVRSAA
jgi:uncharacterized iron-regulated membrane protein